MWWNISIMKSPPPQIPPSGRLLQWVKTRKSRVYPMICSEDLVDQYARKHITSGYSKEQVQKILLNGIKGYITKKSRRQAGGRRRIHHTSQESLGGRIKKKLLGKSLWYRKTSDKDQQVEKKLHGGASTKKNDQQRNRQLKTRAPLFLEQTPNEELARRTKELLQKLEPILGYRIRVVERTGSILKSLLNQTSFGKGLSHCTGIALGANVLIYYTGARACWNIFSSLIAGDT